MSGAGVIRVTILGCGSSAGVPRPNGDWGACDPANPKNRRMRCSILVERAEKEADFGTENVTVVVVDTSPDFRAQMLAAGVKRIDAVLYTHDHADQTHGIDDLRPFALRARRRIPVYLDDFTREKLIGRFGYAFTAPELSPYPAILEAHSVEPYGQPLEIAGPGGPLSVTAFRLEHGRIPASGFRFGPIAYAPDVSGVPEEAFNALSGAKAWIVDALRDTPHPTHATVADALDWLKQAGTPLGVLTNLHVDLDYAALNARLPQGVTAAHDGLRLVVKGETVSLDPNPGYGRH